MDARRDGSQHGARAFIEQANIPIYLDSGTAIHSLSRRLKLFRKPLPVEDGTNTNTFTSTSLHSPTNTQKSYHSFIL